MSAADWLPLNAFAVGDICTFAGSGNFTGFPDGTRFVCTSTTPPTFRLAQPADCCRRCAPPCKYADTPPQRRQP